MLHKKIGTKNDYKRVLDIWEKSVRKTHSFLSKEDLDFYKNIIPENLDDVNVYLWADDDQVVGFSGTSQDELVMLFLDPECIGKGYGSRILQNLMECETIKRIDVNTQNEQAKKFYVHHGFEIESEDKIDGFGKPYPISHLVKK